MPSKSIPQVETSLWCKSEPEPGPSASEALAAVSLLLLCMHLALSNRIPGRGMVNLYYPNSECLLYQLRPVSDVGAIQQIEENCSRTFQDYWEDTDLVQRKM